MTVGYWEGKVVSISTTSGFYTTATGLGPQSLVPPRAGVWSVCRKAYGRRHGNVTMYVVPTGGRAGKSVSRVLMIRRGYGDC